MRSLVQNTFRWAFSAVILIMVAYYGLITLFSVAKGLLGGILPFM